jgi:2,3-bisphosphoglycerate-independent phosphoglycerate mutase
MPNDNPFILIVLDGWGHGMPDVNNAITAAKTPAWDNLWRSCPRTLISGSGLDVGLPDGQMGNSEVGHMTLGSGRVIYQDLTLINKSIADGSFFQNPVLLQALRKAQELNSAIHILGLLSPGGVHSHEEQIFAMVKLSAQQKNQNIYVHAFLDGRDTPPRSALASITALQQVCDQYSNVKIASIMGRYYAMDRDKRLERTNAAVELLVNAKAAYSATSAAIALEMAYSRGETDEFVKPTLIVNAKINKNDVVFFMNFRSDRARQLSHALTNITPPLISEFVTLTEFDPLLKAKVAFPKAPITNVLGEVFQQHNLRQLRIAETEKYAHVTFFFNAGREAAFMNEERLLIPSPKVATYDLEPAMAAVAITDKIIQFIHDKTYDVIICNYANADMVGHTGNLTATITAVEVLDQCLGRITAAIQQYGGQVLITADHGNAETMWDTKHQQPHTAHTTNLVPVIYVGAKKIKFKNSNDSHSFGLQDIAPTILELLNIPKPQEMLGNSLIA